MASTKAVSALDAVGSTNATKLGTGIPEEGKAPLSLRYPTNSTWEFTLHPNGDIADGTVYCTDETSQMIVLQKSLVHTTLTFEVRMVQVASIKNEKLVSSSAENSAKGGDESLSKPLPVVDKKVLEEREKRALRLAEESFRHINQNVSSFLYCCFWYTNDLVITSYTDLCMIAHHYFTKIGICQRPSNFWQTTKGLQWSYLGRKIHFGSWSDTGGSTL
jgi:hypothetical protein